MTIVIGEEELSADSARILDAVAAGEDFVVTRNAEPVALLRPVRERRQRFVARFRLIGLAAAAPHIDATRFRFDLDAIVDPDV